jgi:two-component system sensor histidine kinase VicK
MESFEELNDKINSHMLNEVELTADIQQKELLIAAMRLAEERTLTLAAIVDSSDDAIISKNLQGIVTSWNLAAERIFGYAAEEMIGEPILKLIPADRQAEEPEILSRIRRGERVDHFETKRMTKTGTLVDVSLTISPVKNPAGEIMGISKIARDITDKKLEEQRKNDFIAIVSHELKTPLTSMKSYVQLALNKAKQQKDSFSENMLTRAELQTNKMAKMIHDFLNLSRLEEGKMSLNLCRFSLPELMEEIVLEGCALAPDHLIRYDRCADVEIEADRDKISQVMTNILGNAVKYSEPGTIIEIGCTVRNGMAELAFTDQGVGISATDQKRLFDRFYRVGNGHMTNISGFGIGLYLVSEILRLHDTEITVQSEPGKGSVFTFSLPVLEPN